MLYTQFHNPPYEYMFTVTVQLNVINVMGNVNNLDNLNKYIIEWDSLNSYCEVEP